MTLEKKILEFPVRKNLVCQPVGGGADNEKYEQEKRLEQGGHKPRHKGIIAWLP